MPYTYHQCGTIEFQETVCTRFRKYLLMRVRRQQHQQQPKQQQRKWDIEKWMERSCLLEEVSSLNSDCDYNYRAALIYYHNRTITLLRVRKYVRTHAHTEWWAHFLTTSMTIFGSASKLGTWIWVSAVRMMCSPAINQSIFNTSVSFYQRNVFLTIQCCPLSWGNCYLHIFWCYCAIGCGFCFSLDIWWIFNFFQKKKNRNECAHFAKTRTNNSFFSKLMIAQVQCEVNKP